MDLQFIDEIVSEMKEKKVAQWINMIYKTISSA